IMALGGRPLEPARPGPPRRGVLHRGRPGHPGDRTPFMPTDPLDCLYKTQTIAIKLLRASNELVTFAKQPLSGYTFPPWIPLSELKVPEWERQQMERVAKELGWENGPDYDKLRARNRGEAEQLLTEFFLAIREFQTSKPESDPFELLIDVLPNREI